MIGVERDNRNTARLSRCGGFSLIEVVAATLLVGLLLAAALQTLASVGSVRQRTQQSISGLMLAQSLMAEILNKPHSDPESESTVIGNEQGESLTNRSAFDDIDDFHAWLRHSAENADGTAISGATGWRRYVTVWYIHPTAHTISFTDTGLKQVTVTVTSPQGDSVAVQALRSSLGATQRKPYADRTFLTGVAVELSAGSSPNPSRGRVTLRNHVRGD
ncbi:MAG TPA: hypothetical protein DDW52_29210 [Planctomycetaceae bacterium]|nr:hypothetical protein [Planctomycetaceae bacterium]